ncbi:unnamed protein product, partial [Mesorhabditis spiculigera]
MTAARLFVFGVFLLVPYPILGADAKTWPITVNTVTPDTLPPELAFGLKQIEEIFTKNGNATDISNLWTNGATCQACHALIGTVQILLRMPMITNFIQFLCAEKIQTKSYCTMLNVLLHELSEHHVNFFCMAFGCPVIGRGQFEQDLEWGRFHHNIRTGLFQNLPINEALEAAKNMDNLMLVFNGLRIGAQIAAIG